MAEEGKDGHYRISGGKGNRRGTPQGGVISPLLANLYLHLVDRIWKRHGLEEKYACRLVRYVDDMVLLCARDTARPLSLLNYLLERLGLCLNETKTQIVDARQESFNFLGFKIRHQRSFRSGKRYPHVQPGKRAVKGVKAKLTELTGRNLASLPLSAVMQRLNQLLRGWSGYFDYRNSTKVLGDVRWHAEDRLRTHLRKRHKVRIRYFGYTRFPNAVLYERRGLFKLPTTAPWKRAHALV